MVRSVVILVPGDSGLNGNVTWYVAIFGEAGRAGERGEATLIATPPPPVSGEASAVAEAGAGVGLGGGVLPCHPAFCACPAHACPQKGCPIATGLLLQNAHC